MHKVALLFLTGATVPQDMLWRLWLESSAGLLPQQVVPRLRDAACGDVVEKWLLLLCACYPKRVAGQAAKVQPPWTYLYRCGRAGGQAGRACRQHGWLPVARVTPACALPPLQPVRAPSPLGRQRLPRWGGRCGRPAGGGVLLRAWGRVHRWLWPPFLDWPTALTAVVLCCRPQASPTAAC